ncbi:MAG: DUF4835 family protein [Saprospiraceae bacterium]
MKKIVFFLLILGFALKVDAQELNVQVKVNTPKLQTTDPKVFKTLEDDIKRFLNTKVWTSDKYQLNEKVKCNFTLSITQETGNGIYSADLTVQASRPVFGSNYETTLINYIDKDVSFNYLPNDPINYVQNVYSDRLPSLLAFYSYLILGLDGDSFAPNGGDDYFLICQNIVNTIPSTLVKEGWKPNDNSHNRYWLLENIMSPRLRTMRGAWYTYHRLGLDMMFENVEEGKKNIARALDIIDASKRSYPAAQWLISFMDAKGKEIVEIFKVADKPQQENIANILTRISPTFSARF